MPSPQHILRELAESAVHWRKTKSTYLSVANDKRASEEDKTAARRVHMQAVARLETACVAFEKLNITFKRLKARKDKKPFDWKKAIDGLAMAATALSKATDNAQASPPVVEARVIDVVAES